MHRCLQLAEMAKGQVNPNPMVGAVVVHNNKIIGEGYHRAYGGPHAEVNAIDSVKNTEFLKDSTLFVNLEPCCHWGKTPPCTELIIKSGIRNVIIGSLDPNPLVAGKGVKLLEDAGVTVISGILEPECLNLNQQFFEQFKTKENARFILKWAQSEDGFIGKENYASLEERELSNALVKRYVHKLRSETDAIMVGTNTVLTDDPFLDNRFWFGKTPVAVIIDRTLKIPLNSNLFKVDRKVIILNEIKDETLGNICYVKIDFSDDRSFWLTTNSKLPELGISSVLLEGGSKTLQSFLNSKLPCEIICIKTNKIWKDGIKAPVLTVSPMDRFYLGDDLIELYSI